MNARLGRVTPGAKSSASPRGISMIVPDCAAIFRNSPFAGVLSQVEIPVGECGSPTRRNAAKLDANFAATFSLPNSS